MLGYPAVALIDRDGVSGAPRFHKAALAAGIKPLIGAELTIESKADRHQANRHESHFHSLCCAHRKKGGAISAASFRA